MSLPGFSVWYRRRPPRSCPPLFALRRRGSATPSLKRGRSSVLCGIATISAPVRTLRFMMAGASDYIASSGYRGSLSCWYDVLNGCCCINSRCRDGGLDDTGGIQIEKITDGTSTTIFVVEQAGKPGLWERGLRRLPPATSPSAAVAARHRTESAITGVAGCVPEDNGENWMQGSTLEGLRSTFRKDSPSVSSTAIMKRTAGCTASIRDRLDCSSAMARPTWSVKTSVPRSSADW